MDKVFDKVDGSAAPKEEKKETSLGSKILDSLKVGPFDINEIQLLPIVTSSNQLHCFISLATSHSAVHSQCK
jgi:hypothetical protein